MSKCWSCGASSFLAYPQRCLHWLSASFACFCLSIICISSFYIYIHIFSLNCSCISITYISYIYAISYRFACNLYYSCICFIIQHLHIFSFYFLSISITYIFLSCIFIFSGWIASFYINMFLHLLICVFLLH